MGLSPDLLAGTMVLRRFTLPTPLVSASAGPFSDTVICVCRRCEIAGGIEPSAEYPSSGPV